MSQNPAGATGVSSRRDRRRRERRWRGGDRENPTTAKPNLLVPHLYFLACGQVVRATQERCSHTDWTGGRFVRRQSQAESAFHVYMGHSSCWAAYFSITLSPVSLCRACTEIYYIIVIIIIVIMLQRKMYIDTAVLFLDCLMKICLFSCFAKWSHLESELVLCWFLLSYCFSFSSFFFFFLCRNELSSFWASWTCALKKRNWRKSCRLTCPKSVLFQLLSASSACHLRFSEISVTVSFLIRGLHFCSDECFVVFVLSDKSVHGWLDRFLPLQQLSSAQTQRCLFTSSVKRWHSQKVNWDV